MEQMPAVDIVGVHKRFESFAAVDGVSLQIRQGEFFSLLGPSGCGKTTLLRMIAGFETPTEGALRVIGQDVTALPPHRRPVNMVFQHYALFPHLTVEKNVAFGLRYQDCAGAEAKRRVAEALEHVQLSGFDRRYPHQLSGGQRQRVALARALVLRPRVLLLDEPLGALDEKLRREMQVELKHLQRSLGITFIFVTHDQGEALAMSDRIAVMNKGKVEQVDVSERVFETPRTAFVARFMGASNFFEARVAGREHGSIQIDSPAGYTATIPAPADADRAAAVNGSVRFVVRPEKLLLRPSAPGAHDMEGSADGGGADGGAGSARGGSRGGSSSGGCGGSGLVAMAVTIDDRTYEGVSTLWSVRDAAGERFTIYEQNDEPFEQRPGLEPTRPAFMCWDPRHAVVLVGE